MVTLAEEMPFVAAVADGRLTDTCSACFRQSTSIQMCKSCQVVGYCDFRCTVDDIEFHEEECRFLRYATGKYPKFLTKHKEEKREYGIPEENIRIVSRLILKMRDEDFYWAFNGRQYKDMKHHLQDFKKDPDHREFLELEYQKLIRYMRTKNLPDKETILTHLARFHTNHHFVTLPNHRNLVLGVAMYVGLSFQDHSCRPDAYIIFNGAKAFLRAVDSKAKYSEKLTVSYATSMFTTEKRREQLKLGYFFDCKCVDCKNTKRDAMCHSGRSSCCPDGYVPPGFYNETLFCSKCKKKSNLTHAKITATNRKLEQFMTTDFKKIVDEHSEAADKTIVTVLDYWELTEEVERTLSPYNFYMANYFQFLAFLSSANRREDLLLKFTLWRKRCVDALLPIGDQCIYYMILATVLQMNLEREKLINKDAEQPELEWEFIMDVAKKSKELATIVYGEEHPRYAEATKTLEELSLSYNANKALIRERQRKK